MKRSAPPTSASGLDIARARVAFRDRSLSDVLDLALRFVAVKGRSYAKVALLTVVPLAILSIVAGHVIGWAWAWAASVPLAIVAEIPFTVLASRLVFQDEVLARDVVAAALRDAPRVILVKACTLALVAVGLFVLLVPGLWLMAASFFVPEVTLLERARIGPAFGRSQRIAESAVSDVLLGSILLALLPVALVFLSDVAGRAAIGELLLFEPPRPVWATGGGVLATIGLFVGAPYAATARFFLYLNVRTRTEGWDIQTRFAAIAARTDPKAGDVGREEAA
jgi:hypothetical protein